MNKGSGYDDTSTELLEDGEDEGELPGKGFVKKDGTENTYARQSRSKLFIGRAAALLTYPRRWWP